MKTFSEFISERYYEPDEPLPSGKTPYGKATSSYYRQKGEYFRGGRQNTQTFGRIANQINRRNNQVSRGADNPEFSSKPDRSGQYGIRTDSHKDMFINDKKNKLWMMVKQKPHEIAPGNKPVYTIAWGNDDPNTKRNANTGQARRVVRNVAKMWKNEVVPRLPNNIALHNFPLENEKNPNRNSRSNLYRTLANFGDVDKYGGQYANFRRNPSPKQVAKGVQRTTPLEGGDNIRYTKPEKIEKLNISREHQWTSNAKLNIPQTEPRKIAPAKPSRPLINKAVKALKSTPAIKAPAIPKPSASSIPVSLSKLRLRGRAGLALGAAALGAGAVAAALNRPKK